MGEKIAIVGGGAAGIVAAIAAARKNEEVHLYEQNARPAKKILASGNGRCNISNTDLSRMHYHGNLPSFVDKALIRFDFKKMEKFFRSIGLVLKIEPDGRAYPLSNEARSVHELLMQQLRLLGVHLHTKRKITRIERDGTHRFVIEGLRFRRLLIATGSPAAPQLGGDESGLDLALSLGHTIHPPYPALVGLHLQSPLLSGLAGVKHHAAITLLIDNRREAQTYGDILFTRYGISGFGILDISLHASYALLQGRNVAIALDLLPEFDHNALRGLLASLIKTLPKHPIASLLGGIIPSKLVSAILHTAHIPPDSQAGSLHPKTIRTLVHTMLEWRFRVSDTHGFAHAEVCGGGVETSEVDPETFESKIVKHLHFAGEILDIVGDRGGYNLHFAWASGFLAAQAMSKNR